MKVRFAIALLLLLLTAACSRNGDHDRERQGDFLPYVDAGVPTPVQVPSTPTPFPPELSLEEVKVQGSVGVVKGKVNPPASAVFVQGEEVEVQADGSFSCTVPLRVGTNFIAVQASNPKGWAERILEVERRTPGEGERAGIRVKVLKTEERDAVGKGALRTEPEGVFLAVLLEVSNESRKPVRLSFDNLALEDEEGNVYRPHPRANLLFQDGRSLIGRSIPPATTVKGWVVFDVAPGAEGLRVQVYEAWEGWAAEAELK